MLATNRSDLTLLETGKLVPTAIFAALFGSMLLYFVAFAHSDILHNAAHDVRHAIVAPCH